MRINLEFYMEKINHSNLEAWCNFMKESCNIVRKWCETKFYENLPVEFYEKLFYEEKCCNLTAVMLQAWSCNFTWKNELQYYENKGVTLQDKSCNMRNVIVWEKIVILQNKCYI